MANQTPWILILVIGVLGYFVLSDTNPFASTGTSGGTGGINLPDTNINVPGLGVVCDSTTSPDLTFSAYDGEDTATTIAANFSWRIKGNVAWKSDAFGTTVQNLVAPGDTIEVVAGIANTSAEKNVNYGDSFEYTVPCLSTVTKTFPLFKWASAGNVTLTFFDSDGTAGSNETLNANDVKTVHQKFTAAANTFLGNPYINTSDNPYPNRLCMQLNATGIDSITVQVDGTQMAAQGTPTWLGTANATSAWRCFESPVIDDGGTTFDIQIDVGAAPITSVAECSAGERNITMLGVSWYIDKNGAIKSGVQDENGAQIASVANECFLRWS